MHVTASTEKIKPSSSLKISFVLTSESSKQVKEATRIETSPPRGCFGLFCPFARNLEGDRYFKTKYCVKELWNHMKTTISLCLNGLIFYQRSVSKLVENKSKHSILLFFWSLIGAKTIEKRLSGRQKGGRGRLIEVAA